jgi:hypothetical protein
MEIRKIIESVIQEFINEQARNSSELPNFLKDKEFVNKQSKQFLYHGTSVHPDNFKLDDDWEGDSGNVYDTDLPEGYLFLTNDLREARAYGQYVIPCELKQYDTFTFKVDSDAPSRVFDDDFSGYGGLGIWSKFSNESTASVLEVKGYGKSTFITYDNNVIPRVDLAKEFYS